MIKKSTLFLLTVLSLLFLSTLAQRPQDQGHLSRDHRPIQLEPQIQQNDEMEDPFKKSGPPNPKSKPSGQHHKDLPLREKPRESEKMWNYKSFNENDETTWEQARPKDEDEQGKYGNFNELLKWGMIIGSVFLLFVIVKTCVRKNGRREMRRLRQNNPQRVYMNQIPQQPEHFYVQHPQVFMNAQNPVQEENLEEKIANAERELNKLKAMQHESLKQEFNRKKMEEEQKRIEAQRKLAFEQSRRQGNNWNVGYGPVFYGQPGAQIQMQPQQAFQVKGSEGMRQRSNSFKTEGSERGMMQEEVNYRKGIPIGKPIRQNDNDSSFASQYPEV